MAPAGRQRTFELVPNAPVLGQQHLGDDSQPIYSKPPMTTKQAKKLHNQKNKGPKLSKAEQRRIELMEQDRIRKEFEKEKAQARARTARDKKKAKEEKEKQDRKRKGLPLVDIHPSQDTISRFISRVGIAIGAKRDSTAANALGTVREEDSETATDAGESGTDAGDEEEDGSNKENQEAVQDLGLERLAKRPRLSQADDKTGNRVNLILSQRRAGPLAKIAQDHGTESYSQASSVDTDDSVNQTLLEDQLIADMALASSRSVANREADEQRLAHAPAEHPRAAVPQPVVPVVSKSSASKPPSQPYPLSARMQPPQRTITSIKSEVPPSDIRTASRVPPHLGHGAFKKPNSPYIPAVRPRPAIKPPSFQVSNAPPKFKPPAVQSNRSAERPRFLPKHLNTAQQPRCPPAHRPPQPTTIDTLPSSTQAFLFENVDDLFPSPTQEARELSGDTLPQVPKPKMSPPRLSINGPGPRSGAAIEHNSVGTKTRGPWTRAADPVLPASVVGDSFDSSFILTQDFIISTQDILDIDTPSKAKPKSPPRDILPAVNQEISAFVSQAEKIGTGTVGSDTVQSCSQQPRCSVYASQGDAKPTDAVACCPCGSLSTSHRSQGHRSTCPTTRNKSSPQAMQPEQRSDHQLAAANRPLRSSYQRHAAVAQKPQQKQQQGDIPTSISTMENHSIRADAPNSLTTPENPPPKKRMFGSSGPGPEGLVAMERSYQEMRRQERAREAQFRAQERLMKPPNTLPVKELELAILGFADDLLEDDLDESTRKDSSRRSSDALQQNPDVPFPAVQSAMSLVASQETDYGDIDGDDFDFLRGDTSWLDEGLDDI